MVVYRLPEVVGGQRAEIRGRRSEGRGQRAIRKFHSYRWAADRFQICALSSDGCYSAPEPLHRYYPCKYWRFFNFEPLQRSVTNSFEALHLSAMVRPPYIPDGCSNVCHRHIHEGKNNQRSRLPTTGVLLETGVFQ